MTPLPLAADGMNPAMGTVRMSNFGARNVLAPKMTRLTIAPREAANS